VRRSALLTKIGGDINTIGVITEVAYSFIIANEAVGVYTKLANPRGSEINAIIIITDEAISGIERTVDAIGGEA